jgi:type III pantothenate kinase
MFLAIDIGNTDGVFAVHDGSDWGPRHRIPSIRGQATSDYVEKLGALLGEQREDISHIMMSSVVPELSAPITRAAHELFPAAAFKRMGPDLYPRLPIGILNPEEIGEDIVANMLAAYVDSGKATIVVDFGTALTFIACDDHGQIVGAAIAPGLKTSIKAIFLNTAQLPEVPLEVPDTALGKNTIHALQSGILLGYESLVSGMLERMEREMGQRCHVVATGGLSFVLSTLKHRFDKIDPLLTLRGLRLAFEY